MDLPLQTLYVDTCSSLHIGLLGTDGRWVDHLSIAGKKTGQTLHNSLYDFLAKHQLSFSSSESRFNTFVLNGPGSYTGIRLVEGLAQVLELDRKAIYSGHAHDILAKLRSQSLFVANAFKGQVFVYSTDDKNWDLVAKEEIVTRAEGKVVFAHDETLPLWKSLSVESFPGLIWKEAAKTILEMVLAKKRQPPFYYRDLEAEFSVPNK